MMAIKEEDLKTLKDIQKIVSDRYKCEQKLKEEAMKWILYYNQQAHKLQQERLEEDAQEERIKAKCLQEFFNITKEDLIAYTRGN